MPKWLGWRYQDTGAVVLDNDVLYQVHWSPNTQAEAIINQKAPLPETSEPGLRLEGDGSTPLSADEVAAVKSKAFLDREGWDKFNAELDAKYDQEAADAVATDAFQSLQVIQDTEKYHLKAPRSEKEIVNLLKAHGIPHVVQLVGRTEDKLVLEHAGDTLVSWMMNKTETPDATLRQWATQIANALASLHKLGIHHRDITTFNVLVSADQATATLCDLETGPISIQIKAPEVVIDADAYTEKSDVFSFGILLWSLENRNNPRPFASRYLKRSGQFAAIMEQCLQLDPEQRPTMIQVAQLLRNA